MKAPVPCMPMGWGSVWMKRGQEKVQAGMVTGIHPSAFWSTNRSKQPPAPEAMPASHSHHRALPTAMSTQKAGVKGQLLLPGVVEHTLNLASQSFYQARVNNTKPTTPVPQRSLRDQDGRTAAEDQHHTRRALTSLLNQLVLFEEHR